MNGGFAVNGSRLNDARQTVTPRSIQPWVFYWLPKPNKPEGKEVSKQAFGGEDQVSDL